MLIAEWDWQLCSDSHDDMCPALSGAPELGAYACNKCGIPTKERAVSHILTPVLNISQTVSLPNWIGK
jgi:hypothetical protein